MRQGFLLDPDVAYLNHGGYGACSEPVFAEYQRLQLELERGPTDFFTRNVFRGSGAPTTAPRGSPTRARRSRRSSRPHLRSRLRPQRHLGPERRDPVPALEAGDEVLTTAHEYGAIMRTWESRDAKLVVCEPGELAARIGPRTRVVSVSHVTSPTALVLPVEEACAAARAHGALAIVDGAHAPGQLELDLEAVGADVYAGNCHKWRDYGDEEPR